MTDVLSHTQIVGLLFVISNRASESSKRKTEKKEKKSKLFKHIVAISY
jgi:hypothetical protein